MATLVKPKDIQSVIVQQTYHPLDFIAAKESRLFIRIFRVYVKMLFKRRFKYVWLQQDYKPSKTSRTVYFLNHNSWWDGLIPLMLNEYQFKQQARALMEDKQMREYPFFKRIGAFSISLEDPRKAITSLRYAVKSMQRPHSCLFFYPEGKIQPVGSELNFKKGIGWLQAKLNEVDFVPVGIHMHTIRYDKPELHLHVGKKVKLKDSLTNSERTENLEEALLEVLSSLRSTAGFDDRSFKKFL